MSDGQSIDLLKQSIALISSSMWALSAAQGMLAGVGDGLPPAQLRSIGEHITHIFCELLDVEEELGSLAPEPPDEEVSA
jgi:hypothetical protein